MHSRLVTALSVFTSLLIGPAVEHLEACSGCAPVGHLGVAMLVRDAKIHTGVYSYETDPQHSLTVNVGQRVWAGDHFQENPADPFWVDLPCYGEVAQEYLPSGSTILPPGSQVGFNVLSDLLYWDGSGPVQFGPVPNNEQMRLKYGFMNRYIGTGTGFVAGFNIQTVPEDGVFHRHISYYLLGADGNSVPASQDGVQATDGIYLLHLELTNTGGVANSDPIWFVFRNFDPDDPDAEEIHCAALNHVAHHLAHDRAAADLDFDRDVDQGDVEVLESCASGPGVPYAAPCCESADIDSDGDVDQADFSLMQRCFSGAGVPADPECADLL